MIYGYARVSTDGQSVDARVCQVTKAGCKKVFRETARGGSDKRPIYRTANAAMARAVSAGDAGGKTGLPNQSSAFVCPHEFSKL
jgi:DNA invertase Pin-like site-specific DNA recombinase